MNGGAPQSSGGGGLSGASPAGIVRERAARRSSADVMTSSTHELSIDPTASDDDVPIPAGFKEKK